MRRIGNAKREPGDKQFLTVKQARDKAGERDYAMRSCQRPRTKGWTWADLDREFQASRQIKRMSGKRVKPPAASTRADVKGCFDKPQLVAWQNKRLSDLTDVDLIELLDVIHVERGHGASSKAPRRRYVADAGCGDMSEDYSPGRTSLRVSSQARPMKTTVQAASATTKNAGAKGARNGSESAAAMCFVATAYIPNGNTAPQ